MIGSTNATIIQGGGGDNIDFYKFQDLTKAIKNGGATATNQEYENAEIFLQTIYKKVMEGENE